MNGRNSLLTEAKKNRRVVSLWLPNFSIDRANRTRRCEKSPEGRAQVSVLKEQNALRVVSADSCAQGAGIFPGMVLADARALAPDLRVHEASPADDLQALVDLADWCGQYSPWTAPDVSGEAGENGYGIWLDVAGCAHLFGGEAALLGTLVERLGALGFTARASIADTPGAAWAAVRYGLAHGEATLVTKPGRVRDILRRLPVAALRFSPDVCAGLDRLGLRCAGDLFDLPRGPLVSRFGDILIRRVDQALGRLAEPISPQHAPPKYRARLSFAEPIGKTEDLEEACRRLLHSLSGQLEGDGKGVRRLIVSCFRVDGSLTRFGAGTYRATRNVPHLLKLLNEHIPSVDAGFGIEAVVASADRTDELTVDQLNLADVSHQRLKPPGAAESMAALADRIANRIGRDSVRQPAAQASYLPERAASLQLYGKKLSSREPVAPWFINRARPLSLFRKPEPIEVVSLVPDDPPTMFRWRRVAHRVVMSDGPERIATDWWMSELFGDGESDDSRDYYQVEDDTGDRFWVYRCGVFRGVGAGPQAQWYLHGLFA